MKQNPEEFDITLTPTLLCAVEIQIGKFQRMGYIPDETYDWLQSQGVEIITSEADQLFRGGDCRPSFKAIATGLAVGAFLPGGCRFGDNHFKAIFDKNHG